MIAEIGILIASLLNERQYLNMLIRIHIKNGNATSEHARFFFVFDRFAVNHLSRTSYVSTVAKAYPKIRDNQSWQKNGMLAFFLNGQAGP
ncbi:hypothetical protein DSCW_64440 [Desulfosarcina widdelii]|uniref:Uncharacterized protein n=1 Tax=Desulfosarcina widdelii TaxID=947919 RepID=A0A5K7ZQ58_9BACT|nr:hypothetical protein DSCW_64440 [Desulfosarcina widdelii]